MLLFCLVEYSCNPAMDGRFEESSSPLRVAGPVLFFMVATDLRRAVFKLVRDCLGMEG